MIDKLDLLLELNKKQDGHITAVGDSVIRLEKKVDRYSLQTERRLTSVESSVRLRSKVGGAIAALLPAIAIAVYFLLQGLG